MIIDQGTKVLLSATHTDMRKSINGLTELVLTEFKTSPQSGQIFIFYNRAKSKAKVLFWHYNGFCLLYKRLEKDLFKVPNDLSVGLELNYAQLNRFLEGLHVLTDARNKYDVFY